MRRRILIYGATGYTGRLIAEHARNWCHSLVVAGRTAERVQMLATTLGVTGRAVSLADMVALDETLGDVSVLINAAGPFAQTSRRLIESCLRTRTHYLDITGELPIFQNAFCYDDVARKRGIMIMPGVGLGIVASDCLARYVATLLPNAKYLRIGILRPSAFSRGTFRSALGMANSRVSIRRNGRLTSVPVGRLQRAFDYGDGERESVAVSWADVFTAYYSTGILNIEAYLETDVASRILYQVSGGIVDAIRFAPIQRWINLALSAWPEGPSAQQRCAEKCVIVAEAEDSWRRLRLARLETQDGYSFTAEAASAIAMRAMRGDFLPGFQTPAQVYGADFVLGFNATRREELRLPYPDR